MASSGNASVGVEGRKKLIINAFVESCSGHQSPGLWRHPRDRSFDFNRVQHWVELAKLLEKGKFHGMFIADVLVSRQDPCPPLLIPKRLTTTAFRVHTMSTKAHATQTRP